MSSVLACGKNGQEWTYCQRTNIDTRNDKASGGVFNRTTFAVTQQRMDCVDSKTTASLEWYHSDLASFPSCDIDVGL